MCNVSAVTARHHSPPSNGPASSLPAPSQSRLKTSVCSAKNTASSVATYQTTPARPSPTSSIGRAPICRAFSCR